MTPPADKPHIDALAELLDARGLNAEDFIQIVDILGALKKKESTNIEKKEREKDKGNKIFVDKEFVFETRDDCFIYRDGRTKTGNYYVRIYDADTKKVYSKSLRTRHRVNALVAAETLYREKKDKLMKGVKMVSITTNEMVELYLKRRSGELTHIPKTGITHKSYDRLKQQLKYWTLYIRFLKLEKVHIEKLSPDIGRDFGNWILNQPKQYYKETSRSRETINHIIASVKKMYRDIALEEKYITYNEFPKFKYLKVQPDNAPKRDVLNVEEYEELTKWMQNKYCREKGLSELEQVKRRVFALYFSIHYNIGARTKEVLGMRWSDITINPNDSAENKKRNRVIHIHAENSKTGKSRNIVAPIAEKLERIKKHYKKIGYEPEPNDFVFINLSKTKRGANIAYQTPALDKRLKSVLELSGLKERLDQDGRHITLYSARHFYCTQRLLNKVDMHTLSLNMGTSITYIETTYSHLTTLLMSEEITKGQGWRPKGIDDDI
ncbi:tyrosine-type recombinase/integrase [Synechococcus sp. CB0205]|uniref:tyrosine-type recombinase/integrase n=1 Tax=Synechococcus sp. CB0205 TaxID=232363 RepID=UPI00020013A0|nr:tyrosine-type recombinase/integrase [Synechococcus sp. CB0205]